MRGSSLAVVALTATLACSGRSQPEREVTPRATAPEPATPGEPVADSEPALASPTRGFATQRWQDPPVELTAPQRALLDRYLPPAERDGFADWGVDLDASDLGWFSDRSLAQLSGWRLDPGASEPRRLPSHRLLLRDGELEELVAAGTEDGPRRTLGALLRCPWAAEPRAFASEGHGPECEALPPAAIPSAPWAHRSPRWLLKALWSEERAAIWDGPGDSPEAPLTWLGEPRRLTPMEQNGRRWTGFGVLTSRVVAFELLLDDEERLEGFESEVVATF